MDLVEFGRRLAMLQAGIRDEEGLETVFELAASLPEEMLAPFLMIARVARDKGDCPGDAELAALYRTASASRARRMLEFIEERGLIICRTDLSGKRTISLPHLGWSTAAAQPNPGRPSRMARIMDREARSASR
jgi:hypothetical protein